MAKKKKSGNQVVLMVHEATGESYATKAKSGLKLALKKYSRKLRRHVIFKQKKASS
tara:strand:+ start:163 stop:330 length:168 start_codon:yes stop_codon:yes gene_type:complete